MFWLPQDFFHFQSGEGVDAVDEAVEDEDHDGHAGHHDDDVTPEGHFAHFLGEGFRAGFGLDEDFGQDEVEDGGEEEGEGEEVRAVDQEFVEGGGIAFFSEDVFHFVDLHHLVVKDEEPDEGLFCDQGDEDGDAEERGDGGFFDRDPFLRDFKKCDEAG